jgi:hypothetical protein
VKSTPNPGMAWHCLHSLASDLGSITRMVQPYCISIECVDLGGQSVLSRRFQVGSSGVYIIGRRSDHGGVKNRHRDPMLLEQFMGLTIHGIKFL